MRLGPGLTVVSGRNGAGKTNLLEALYFACTGRSCRTANEREVVRFGAELTRLELTCEDELGRHDDRGRLQAGRAEAPAGRRRAGGATWSAARRGRWSSVFLPDRLELVARRAGAAPRAPGPGRRRAVARRARGTRRAYSAALAQRNALLASIRAGRASRASLPAWDAELARHGVALMADRDDDRRAAAPALRRARRGARASRARSSCATGRARRRPTPRRWPAELAERVDSDLERGFTGHGPHRDDLAFRREGRELRAYGSRGQQRLGLLALLLAEREELAAERGAAPLLLLDDVMCELDATRRERLASLLRRDGQAVITTTELDARARRARRRTWSDRIRRSPATTRPRARVAGTTSPRGLARLAARRRDAA